MELTHLSLFSGIGGIDLAAHWAGFKTVQFVEIDPFCQKVLAKNFPGVPIHGDIHTFDGHALDDATLLTGGFPCQPFSVAGKRRGSDDSRHLWPDMLRVIRECRPTWVVGENVDGFSDARCDEIRTELEAAGYASRFYRYAALAVGANHYRRRLFFVAHPEGGGRSGWGRASTQEESLQLPRHDVCTVWRDLPRPRPCRGINGLPGRVDRLRALGNAVVPQQVYPLLAAIARWERGDI